MSKYPKVKFGDFVKHVVREVELEVDKEYPSVGVKWYGEGVHVHEVKSGGSFNASRFEIKANDIIYNDMWARNGSVAIVPAHLDGAVASSHFPTFLPDLARVLPKYLEYYFKTRTFWDDCENASRGSTGRNQIKKSTFYAIEIPLPPLTEQRRIVKHIESLARRVNEAQSLREEAEKETGAFLYSALNSIFSELHFVIKLIGELCETTSGGTPSRSRGDFFQGNIPWIKSGELEDDYIYRAEEHISDEALSSSSAKIFPKGTLVVALYGATVGKTGILEIDACTNQAVCALFPNDEMSRDYLWWFLRSKRPDYLKSSFGGAQPNISQKVIRETEIPVPPLDEQRRIVAYLDGLQAKVNALRELQSTSGEELSALMASVLDRAFKGEL